MNRSDAVDAESFSTLADRTSTMPNWAMTSPQNSGRFVKMVATRAGDDAMNQAVIAVTARPAHIQP